MPSRAHSPRTSANSAGTAPAKSLRNRATVTWSGRLPPQMTRNARSWPHSRSIRRDDVTSFAYAQISSVTSMSGSYPAAPAPPVLRRAWNAEVSSCPTASITSHTG